MERSWKTRRIEAGLTQVQLASMAHVSPQTVSDAEKGQPILETTRQRLEAALQQATGDELT